MATDDVTNLRKLAELSADVSRFDVTAGCREMAKEIARLRLKAERDVLREFVEAVANGRVSEWDKRHGLHGISWNASAKHCLCNADAAKTGK